MGGNFPEYHYVVARNDLPKGMAAAQIVHAAGESVIGLVEPGTIAVVLGVADESALEDVCFRYLVDSPRLSDRERLHRVVETEGEYAGQLMAVGITPAPRSRIPDFMRGLKLYG